MSEVERIPNWRAIEREASAWIARLNADDVTPEDRARFETWRTAHRWNDKAYAEASALWTELTSARPLVQAVAFGESMSEARVVRLAGRNKYQWRAALAAAACLVLSITAALFFHDSGNRYSTAVGEHVTVSLPDGSTMELNSDSSARIDYSTTARVVRLDKGEGFFKVAHNTTRPFWVVGGGSWVRAVGTAFGVYLRPDDVRVTVSEGTVKVGGSGLSVRAIPTDAVLAGIPVAVLTAGEQVDVHGSATSTRKLSPAQVQRTQTWREGTLYFENQPLSDVVQELSRYTPNHLVIADERLAQMSIGGTFQANPDGAEAFLTMLEQGFGLAVRRESGRVVIDTPARK